jgi:hypothetical protein
MVSGKMTKRMVKEHVIGRMVQNMKVDSKMAYVMARVYNTDQTEK